MRKKGKQKSKRVRRQEGERVKDQRSWQQGKEQVPLLPDSLPALYSLVAVPETI
jgi:hypothetical protein